MKAYDVFSYQMHIGWPVPFHQVRLIIEITQGLQIIRQRINPDIDDMLRIKVNRNTPAKGGS